MPYIYLIISFTLNGIANLLLRFSALNEPALSLKEIGLQSLVEHKWLLLGLSIFAGNVIFYMLALRNLPVSIAYPVMVAMSLLIVAAGANFLFKESVTGTQIIGYILLIVAIYLLTVKKITSN